MTIAADAAHEVFVGVEDAGVDSAFDLFGKPEKAVNVGLGSGRLKLLDFRLLCTDEEFKSQGAFGMAV